VEVGLGASHREFGAGGRFGAGNFAAATSRGLACAVLDNRRVRSSAYGLLTSEGDEIREVARTAHR
jgi:hypothetical protein